MAVLGYLLLGPREVECNSNYTWADVSPLCEPVVCAELSPVQFGYISYSSRSRRFNSLVSVECERGYSLIGKRCIRVISFSVTEHVFGCSFSLPAQNCD